MISRRAGALRREQQEKRRTNAPPSRKPDAPLGSLSSVALSCCISKATTLYNPFDGNVNSVTLLRHRLSTLRGAVHFISGGQQAALYSLRQMRRYVAAFFIGNHNVPVLLRFGPVEAPLRPIERQPPHTQTVCLGLLPADPRQHGEDVVAVAAADSAAFPA